MPLLKLRRHRGPPRPLQRFLSSVPPSGTQRKLHKTAARNIRRAASQFGSATRPVIVDAGAGRLFGRASEGVAPTLLSSRCKAGGYYWLQALLSCTLALLFSQSF